ncbi:MAG: DNA adenine methylase [Gemmatimonadetes bacterium]|nr:DNA adenine methylase [Gemmatimonadota bacterium]
MTKQLTALPYYGGKQRLASWIADHLPLRRDYVEPFGGMASVLLSRPPSHYELLNDPAELVVNWWRVVRDDPGSLRRLLKVTPSSRVITREAYEAARDSNETPLRRAWAFHVVAVSTMSQNVRAGTWRPVGTANGSWVGRRDSADLEALAERMANVELECIDGVELLRRIAGRTTATVYVDPPYRNANTRNYLAKVDHDALVEVLLSQRGACAVSGYADDWPELEAAGWRVTSRAATVTSGPVTGARRAETLWMNYTPDNTLDL